MYNGDKEIIELFHVQGKKENAFRLLVNRYSEKLYWHIRKIVLNHEDSNDILQNVFLKVWQGLAEFRYEAKLYTWMYRIATNESLNFLDEKKRKVHGYAVEITEMLENTLESDLYFSGDRIQLELQKSVLRLTERQRLIFNMKYFDDMTYEEIAEVLDVAVGTLKATYHNAVKKIEENMRLMDSLTL
ncbi:MAG: sigma-70 family RNA polymerase sigma factor [Culturomica sp.]|jgi:RNA polymerase sigma-70 factor (ECF subfamily)|nr:sigma-70 family RNA polymerase sigma factor [Culturomica sp.]